MSATSLLAQNPQPSEDEIADGDPGQHLPLHRLREHRRGDRGGVGQSMSTTETVRPRAGRAAEGLHRPVDPAQGGQAARPGPGRLRRRRQAGTGWATSTSSARRTRTRRSSRSTSRPRSALDGVYGTLTRRRGRDPDRPVLRADDAARATRSRTTRSRSARVRHIGEPVVAVVRRDARARARRRRARRGRVRAARRARRRARARSRTRRSCTTTPARTSSGRASSTGATSTAR